LILLHSYEKIAQVCQGTMGADPQSTPEELPIVVEIRILFPGIGL
jgi:hypothetical protein